MVKIVFWASGIYEVLTGDSKVAGIQVQQSRWALTFMKNGWDVYCLANKPTPGVCGVNFIEIKPHAKLIKMHLSLLAEFIENYKVLHREKPSFIIARGSGRYLYLLSKMCRWFNVKLVFFSASDVNFVPGKDTVTNSESYTKLYRKAIPLFAGYVTQNNYQADTLLKNYHRHSLILPNIWIVGEKENVVEKKIDCIWVSNLRRLKRAEWFVNMARKLSQYSFVMVGGVSEQSYYDKIVAMSKEVDNLEFLGAQPMERVSSLIAESRLLACTSEYEGFPNTFIQAWANSVPVVSTVDPSNVIRDYDLGVTIQSEKDFTERIIELLTDDNLYKAKRDAVNKYFIEHHDADSAYLKLHDYLRGL